MAITVTITVRSGDDVSDLKPLLDRLRARISALTIFEAPKGIEYSYSFPVVTVSTSGRHFGEDAKDVLKDLAA
jgi:hypothetical protein